MKTAIDLGEYRMAICDILNSHITASLSTMNERSLHSNTIYYCYDDNIDIYFASDCSTEHSINIANNKNVALSVWDEPEQYGQGHRGLQIEGTCVAITGLALMRAWDLYIKRFPIFKMKIGDVKNIVDKIVNMRLYKISISRIQLTDVAQYGIEIKDIRNEQE